MTAATAMVAVPTGLTLAASVVGALLWWRSYRRDPGNPQTPEWREVELRTMPAGWTPPSGRHRYEAERAAQQIARSSGYLGRHSEDELPPSIAALVLSLPVTYRARVLVWSLGRPATRPAAFVPPRTRLVVLGLGRRLKLCGGRGAMASALRYGPSKAVRP